MNRIAFGLIGASAFAAAAFAVPAMAQDITIASAGPMTGQYAAFGMQLRRGAEMAGRTSTRAVAYLAAS